MKQNGFKLFLSFILLLTTISVSAQIKVTGVVVDEYKETMPGVNILQRGTVNGVMTDLDGKYTLTVPSDTCTLVVSFLGYKKQEIKIGSKRTINVEMEINAQALGVVEVISDGYTEVRIQDYTGSASQVSLGDMKKTSAISFDQSLAGRVAGVQVSSNDGKPGSTFNITIRGNNSLTQSNSPLYVIDGFAVEVDDTNVGATISPDDIESLNILKDAAATAIYGSRGANGVVVITTKKGKLGKPTVSYNGTFSVQHVRKKMNMMSPYEFVKLQTEVRTADEMNTSYFSDDRTLDSYRDIKGYDWQDEIFRSAFMHSHYANLMGGKDGTKYSASLSYNNQEGVIINSGYERYQARINLEQEVTSKLKFYANANYARGITTGTNPAVATSSATGALMYSVFGYRPVAWEKWIDLLTSDIDPALLDNSNDYRFNPIMSAKEEYRKNYDDNLSANTYLDYKITDKLKAKVSGSFMQRKVTGETFNNSRTRYGNAHRSLEGMNGSVNLNENNKWVNENTVSYSDRIKNHIFSGFVGMTLQREWTKQYSTSLMQIPLEELGISGMDDGLPKSFTSVLSENALMSYFGRINYNYAWKYYFNASFRADGSSKFPSKNRWGYFPSVSGSWIFNRESFLKPQESWLSNGKLRLSWGQTGNNRVTDFASYARMGGGIANEYSFNDSYNYGYVYSALANKNLKWETTEQWNVGVDLGFLENRIAATVDLYWKNTKDLLLFADLPSSTGFEKVYMNIGEMKNKGVEFTLNTVNVKTKDFQWSTSFNISFNQNEIGSLVQDQEALLNSVSFDSGYNSAMAYISQKGKATGQFFGYICDGTYKYDDFDQTTTGQYILKPTVAYHGADRNAIQPGDIKLRDINGDGVVNDDDKTVIGRGQPIHTGGFTNNFTYKNWDLSVFLQWSYGNDILNANRLFFESGERRRDTNQFASYADRWTPENSNSNIPRVGGQGPRDYSSRVIEDGSYLRIKNISLGYNFTPKLAKKLGMSSARVFMSADNLVTFTSYSGYDPEVSVRNSALTPGFDYSSYPRALTVSAGLNVSF